MTDLKYTARDADEAEEYAKNRIPNYDECDGILGERMLSIRTIYLAALISERKRAQVLVDALEYYRDMRVNSECDAEPCEDGGITAANALAQHRERMGGGAKV